MLRCLLCLLSILALNQDVWAESRPDRLSLEPVQRIKMATITTRDIVRAKQDYTEWLDYRVRDRGVIDAALAASWGAPAVKGKPYVFLVQKLPWMFSFG